METVYSVTSQNGRWGLDIFAAEEIGWISVTPSHWRATVASVIKEAGRTIVQLASSQEKTVVVFEKIDRILDGARIVAEMSLQNNRYVTVVEGPAEGFRIREVGYKGRSRKWYCASRKGQRALYPEEMVEASAAWARQTSGVPEKIVNLTPHALRISVASGVLELPPSGTVARCAEQRENMLPLRVGGVEITVSAASFGAVEGRPAPEEGVVYVVSALVLAAAPGRADVFAPGPAVRDADGRIIGCLGLTCSPAYARLHEEQS
jgi:hypothetical protein